MLRHVASWGDRNPHIKMKYLPKEAVKRCLLDAHEPVQLVAEMVAADSLVGEETSPSVIDLAAGGADALGLRGSFTWLKRGPRRVGPFIRSA